MAFEWLRGSNVPSSCGDYVPSIGKDVAIQASMMTNGDDVALQIFRFFNSAELNKLSQMPSAIHNFVTSWHFVFAHDPAGCLSTGFTAYTLQPLQKTRLVKIGVTTSIICENRKVTAAILEGCTARMTGWLRMAVLEALAATYAVGGGLRLRSDLRTCKRW